MQFLLNNQLRSLNNIPTNTTVLEYLRLHEIKTGTKEGCASGDCGACTVVVAGLIDDELVYKSINSCIALVGTLHGKQLITVEDLSDGALHPCQQAMVDCHGSQCGFCTPGFVMSLFALYQDKQTFTRHEVDQYLAGNLCRCTGYQAIYKAADELNHTDRNDQFLRQQEQTKHALRAINKASDGDFLSDGLSHGKQRFFWPHSLKQLGHLLAEHKDARLCAGCTDLSLEITQQHRQLDTLIFTGDVIELQHIKLTDSHLEIGAAVTYEQALPILREQFPAFVDMLLRLGSKQIRNVATFGGNIANASPIGDTPPCFIALDAELVLDKQGVKRRLPLQDYFVDYKQTRLQAGECISMIRIPRLQTGQIFKVYKTSKRIDDDISAVAAAFRFDCEQQDGKQIISDVRLAYGGMAATPKRARQAEQVLLGREWSQANIEKAMQAMETDFTPMTDVRASAAYRMTVAKNLLFKAWLESQTETPLDIQAFANGASVLLDDGVAG